MTLEETRRFDIAKHYATVLRSHLGWVFSEMFRDGASWGVQYRTRDGVLARLGAAELERLGRETERHGGKVGHG